MSTRFGRFATSTRGQQANKRVANKANNASKGKPPKRVTKSVKAKAQAKKPVVAKAKAKRPVAKRAAKKPVKKPAKRTSTKPTSTKGTKATKKSSSHLAKYKWKPGQSGNPAGRPKRKTMSELLYARLMQKADDVPGAAKLAKRIELGELKDLTIADLLIEITIELACKGNAPMMAEIWNRSDGKRRDADTIHEDGPTIIRTPFKVNRDE